MSIKFPSSWPKSSFLASRTDELDAMTAVHVLAILHIRGGKLRIRRRFRCVRHRAFNTKRTPCVVVQGIHMYFKNRRLSLGICDHACLSSRRDESKHPSPPAQRSPPSIRRCSTSPWRRAATVAAARSTQHWLPNPPVPTVLVCGVPVCGFVIS